MAGVRAGLRRAGGGSAQPDFDALLTALEQRQRGPDRLAVKEGDRILFVPVQEIDWCEAADNYVRIHLQGRRHLVRETMRDIERTLGGSRFVRIHRSVLVNLSRIRELRPLTHGEYEVVLQNGTKLTLSRTYRDSALARIVSR
jgi:two-component system LytT family response regulator